MGTRQEYERAFLYPEQHADNPDHWASEGAYFKSDDYGLGEDAGESVVLITPSGAASAPQAATTPQSQAGVPWYESLAKTFATTVLPVAASVYQQKKITDLNTERLRAGLPMLSPQQYSSMYPTASVAVGPNDQAKKLLMYGAVGVGALVLLRAFKVI